MVNPSRRDVINYAGAAVANIGAFSALGYAASRAFGEGDARFQIAAGGPDPYLSGAYNQVVDWPIIAIQAVLLPSGAVMSFGTDTNGNQGAFIHDVWNPGLGTGPPSHYTLPNGVTADFFCSAASLQTDGTVLIADGDLTINGVRNYSNNASTVFDPRTNTVAPGLATGRSRWYPSLVSLPNGAKALFGGIYATSKSGPAPQGAPVLTPQITRNDASWMHLSGAASEAAFAKSAGNWAYPRAYVIPGGNVGILTNDGLIFTVDTSGQGAIAQIGQTGFLGWYSYPTLSYAPGKWLSIRANQVAITIDFGTGGSPVVTQVANLDQERQWASATILADGRVLINGGSTVINELVGVAYQDTIWDPQTGQWTPGAVAQIPRLYHNSSLLLTNGTVLTAGGGAPGPLVNLNAQIYYPSYLFGSNGTLAARPTLAVSHKFAFPGNVINGAVGPNDNIVNVTAVRTGSMTHSYNSDSAFLQPAFEQVGQQLNIQLPIDTSALIPGYWMIFAWNDQGVPSRAAVVHVALV